MRDGRAWGFGLAGVSTGAAALALVASLVGTYEDRIEEARQPEDVVLVAVAARDLYPGLPIGEDDLYALQMAPRYLPAGAFVTPEHVVGRVPRERILGNEVVRGERLADVELGRGMNVVVPRGLRAMSVALADARALSGLLQPGDSVDVLFTAADPGTADEETTTLLQAVYVLGVDSRMGTEDAEQAERARGRHAPTVTLLVDPGDAERVAHAAALGELRLTLRNRTDDGLWARPVARKEAPAPASAPAVGPEVVRCQEVWIYHGGKRIVLLVDEHGKPCVDGRP